MAKETGSVVVTGASGALGRALVAYLGAEGLSGWRGGAVPGDWLARMERAEVVVHAAGPSSALAGEQGSAAAHVALAEALAARSWQGRMVFLSSAAVYGEPVHLPVPETARLAPVNAYGAFKLAVERGLAAVLPPERLVILRLANVYGTPLDLSRRRVAALILDALRQGKPFTTYGDGSSERDYLHVSDFCAGVAAAARSGRGTLNLGSGEGTSLDALIAACEAVTGRRLDRRAEPERTEAAACVLDTARARRIIGWHAEVPLAEGLRRLAAEMRAGAPERRH